MDTAFFIASKVLGALLRPDTWIVLTVGAIVLALIRNRTRLAMWTGSVLFSALVCLSILPLGDLLLQPIELRYPTHPPLARVDGIIVLGGGEEARASAYWDQTQLNEAGERFTAALALAKRFPNARLLFTGGSGALRDLGGVTTSEASIAVSFFLEQGMAHSRLLLEGGARNTTENASLSRSIASPLPDQTWVLVTSAFHMPRAMRSFQAAGWPGLVAWPVDYRTSRFADSVGWDLTRNLKVLNTAVREQIGQVAYRLTGR